MQQRNLGQGLTVSAIGYGAMGIHVAYGPSDQSESIAAKVAPQWASNSNNLLSLTQP